MPVVTPGYGGHYLQENQGPRRACTLKPYRFWNSMRSTPRFSPRQTILGCPGVVSK